MGLRLNWFSPLPPTKSGIATDFTAPLAKELSALCELTLWTSQTDWDVECDAPVRRFSSQDHDLADFQPPAVNIYHLGNNPFHQDIYKLSRRVPGVVVLHETNLLMFFSGLFRDAEEGVAEMIPLFESCGEHLGRHLANNYCRGHYQTRSLLQNYPMTLAALTGACGVVTHSRAAFSTVAAERRWPVQYLPLPYQGSTLPASGPKQSEHLHLIVFGHIGSNRCLEAIVDAMASYHTPDRLCLDVYGELAPDHPALEITTKSGIHGKNVRFHGFVTEEALDAALGSADLAINLRFPTMGEASISQLRIWHHALPSLVTPVGWYAGQPDDTVGWVRPYREREDLHRHFDAFFANPGKYHAMGQQGRAHYLRHHQPAAYAAAIVKFARLCAPYRRQAIADRLLNDILPGIKALKQKNGLLPNASA